MKVQEIVQIIERVAPRSYAFYPDDNNGLLVGDFTSEISKVLIALDLTEDVLEEAISLGCELIITHHPFIFKGLKNVRMDNVHGRLLTKAIRAEINIYACHTNLDVSKIGVNEALRKKLELDNGLNIKILQPTFDEKYYKLAIYVPQGDVEKVLDSITKAGAGHVGNYSHCTFQTKGTGTFTPLDGANPYIGNVSEMQYVDEVKLESIVPEKIINRVVSAMKKAHPYEEVAYDVLPLVNESESIGLGQILVLERSMTSEGLAKHIIDRLGCEAVKVFGTAENIKKIAICGGSGSSVIHLAKYNGCQALITGDVDYHKGQMAVDLGLTVIDAGHYYTEVPVLEELKRYLDGEIKGTEIFVTNINTCPYKIVSKQL